MAAKLEKHYNILYRGRDGLSAHEFIVDLRPFKASTGVVEEDVAKRLQVSVGVFHYWAWVWVFRVKISR